jgi:2,3,4,5-tetrahydropyridine-2-carboxylate N-succinyltransferase
MKEIISWGFEDIQNRYLDPKVIDAVRIVIDQLDAGTLRVADRTEGAWSINEWVKKAILLYFRQSSLRSFETGIPSYDKIPLKAEDWDEEAFSKAGIRFVPGSIVRKGAFVAPGVILMPSFVNIGAYVGQGTMIDTWSTIGSCAQIGANCHISGGVGIGGVLEPLQASPVIIEDNCFIGARSEIAEGVIVEEGAVISMGVFIGASTRIVDRETGTIIQGRVPAYSVVVPGSLPSKNGVHLSCAVIVKRVDEQTRSKTSINELLRD